MDVLDRLYGHNLTCEILKTVSGSENELTTIDILEDIIERLEIDPLKIHRSNFRQRISLQCKKMAQAELINLETRYTLNKIKYFTIKSAL